MAISFQAMIDQFAQNDMAMLGSVGVLAFFLGIYLYQEYIRKKDEPLFETVDWAEDILAPTLRSDMATWGEKCRIKFLQDFDFKYYAIKKKRFNVVSNLEKKLEDGDYPGSEEFLSKIDEYRDKDAYEEGVMIFRMIKPMLTKSFWPNYIIYILLEKTKVKRVSWLAVIPRQWIKLSSTAIQLHKNAQFFELVDGIHFAESFEVWKAFYGVHYSELHDMVLTSFNNQYQYINKFYPEHGMELEKVKTEAEAEANKYRKGTVEDVND